MVVSKSTFGTTVFDEKLINNDVLFIFNWGGRKKW